MRCLAVLALLAACARGNFATPADRVKPRLVVLVVIDQWPTWVFEQQQHLFTGGIGRVLREGAVAPRGELPYANTLTAVGHATLATGTTPSVHGVVGNYWFRRDEDRDRAAEYDPTAPVLTVGRSLDGDQPGPDDGASGRVLRVEGVADVLRRATSGTARSVTISLKPRAAALMAGRRPDLAIWYEPSAGGMTTSKAYADAAPQWLVERPVIAYRWFRWSWRPGDPALLARETKLPDDAPGERSEYGLGAAFPHDIAAAKVPAKAIQQTPAADRVLAEFAAIAVDQLQLGKDQVPDLLAISFGAHDFAGHDWGPDSWEVLDLTLELDRTLGELFDRLDERVGKNEWAVIVTSDHGATPVVERARVRGARRIPPKEIEQVAEQALEAALGAPGPWVADLVSNNLYLTAKFRDQPEAARMAALDAVAAAVAAVPNVAAAGRTDRLSADCTAERDLLRAICLGSVPGASGELYVYPQAGSSISSFTWGTHHDAPFDDNRRVPILVMAPGVAHHRGHGSLLQVAPTLAALLGIPPPEAAKAPPLFGITTR